MLLCTNSSVNRMLRKGYDIITDKTKTNLLFNSSTLVSAVQPKPMRVRNHILFHFMHKNRRNGAAVEDYFHP